MESRKRINTQGLQNVIEHKSNDLEYMSVEDERIAKLKDQVKGKNYSISDSGVISYFHNKKYYNRRFSIINKNEGKELSRVKSIIQDVKGGIGNG